MRKIYKISQEETEKIKEIRKTIKDKNTDRRFHTVQLRGEGYSDTEIAKQLETSTKVVSRWICTYIKGGTEALYPKKRNGHHRNMSEAEEKEFLKEYIERAQKGQIIEVSEIKQAYIEKVGHSIGNGQIYRVLKRNGWRKVMPRSQHPKKASEEAIEASKKLKKL